MTRKLFHTLISFFASLNLPVKMSHSGKKEISLNEHVEHASTIESVKSNEKDVHFHGKYAAEAQQIAAQWLDHTPEEKTLLRKLDWRILPCTWVLYLLGYLDRANVGFVNVHLNNIPRSY